MQVKVFEADDMNSGLKLIKEELGPDALIISTKTIRGGQLGLGKNRLEITAAVDNAVPPVTRREFDKFGNETSAHPQNAFGNHAPFSSAQERGAQAPSSPPTPNLANPYMQNRREQTAFNEPPPMPAPLPVEPEKNLSHQVPPQATTQAPSIRNPFSPPEQAGNGRIHDDMQDLKNLVRNLAGEVARLQPQYNDAQPQSRGAASHADNNPLLSFLQSKGLSDDISYTVATFLENHVDSDDILDPNTLSEVAVQGIQNMLEVYPILQAPQSGQQRIAFVGSTGVGKTTTLAKIAAARLSLHREKIALITIDTYRIAAVEQLKVYGEIMNLPVDVVITPEQLENALTKHHDCDLILIDTAGRSPKDDLSIEELRSFLKPDLQIEKHLVISASTREEESIDTINRFSKLDIHGTIFTKIDECSQLGSLLNVQLQNNTPISCLTNGQRVPEDLVDISPNAIAKLIMSTN